MSFTTRPSFTSRQGIMRLASIRQCLLELNNALVNGLTDDHAVQARMIEFGKAAHIRNGGNSARCNDRQVRIVQHLSHSLDVRSVQYAVARNVRVDHKASPKFLQPLRERNGPDV